MSPPPTRALANGVSAVTKLRITAPFITVGRSPARSRIQAIIAVVVDLPLVPAMPTARGAALKSSASSSARVTSVAPTWRAARTSGMVSSTAAEATTTEDGVTPLPSCGNRAMPRARKKANFSASRPWSRARSDPATVAPPRWTINASGSMPLPPIPQKKYCLSSRIGGGYNLPAHGASGMGEAT